ncbi:MAG TPA: aromatic-ring-hydroxylating dioxygenase subunit beta [Burkholderiales bacterium]|nr:aromatic-ring-hydroxylating dioxygenase subunit beta [Burkholderiales bacterium]
MRELREEVEALLLREARLLDERRFAEWLELYAEDALYWVPTRPEHRSPADGLALFHESRALLEIRVARLQRADMHVQSPPARTLHQVSAIEVSASSEPGWQTEARSALVVAECREARSRWFAGRALHGLRRTPAGLRIALKRVDLIDSDRPHGALAVPF